MCVIYYFINKINLEEKERDLESRREKERESICFNFRIVSSDWKYCF